MTYRPFLFNISGAILRRADLSKTRLDHANLKRADLTGTKFRGADFKDAKLDGAILIGADLTDAKNLTIEQLKSAIIDETTILPSYLDGHAVRSAA